jgi:hypothetical protein
MQSIFDQFFGSLKRRREQINDDGDKNDNED